MTTLRSRAAGAFAAAALSGLCALPLAAQTSAPQPPADQPPAGGPQTGGPRGMRSGRGMQMLMEGITLSDAQRTKIDSINGAFRERMMQSMPSGGAAPDSATRAARFQGMRRSMEEHASALRAVLTPDQQKTFDANVARQREMMQQRMRDGAMGRGPGRGGFGGGQPSGGSR